MLVAVDVGNTQTVIGLFRSGSWVSSWRMASDGTRTADELHIKMNEFFQLHAVDRASVDLVIIGSVVPHLTLAWEQLCAMLVPAAQTLIVDEALDFGIEVGIAHPHELGADRIANAVAASARYGAPVIVVDFGTATNLDVVDAAGVYRGGVISPGVETSANALFSHAARLSQVDLEAPPAALGDSTLTAIQSGLIYGEAAKVDGLVDRVVAELGTTPHIVATGGLAPLVAPYCMRVDEYDDTLTLDGLRLIGERNRIA